MKQFFKKNDAVDREIERICSRMSETSVDSVEYDKLSNRLHKLYEVKTEMEKPNIDRNTMAIIVANLATVGLILIFESNGNIITTKALSFIKGRG